MEILKNMPVVEEGVYIKQVSFEKELTIIMDGKNRQALISFDE
jgi:hypothetical protein